MKVWQKTRVLLAIVAIFATLAGCRSGKEIGGSTHHQTDSIRTEIRWREVFIHDTVPFFIPVEKHSSVGGDSSHLETDFTTSDAFVDSLGKLHHSLENKAQQIDIPVSSSALVSDTSHYESHAKVDTIRIPEPYPVEVEKKLTGWQKFQMNGFWWLAVGLVGYVLWLTRKMWVKFIFKK